MNRKRKIFFNIAAQIILAIVLMFEVALALAKNQLANEKMIPMGLKDYVPLALVLVVSSLLIPLQKNLKKLRG